MIKINNLEKKLSSEFILKADRLHIEKGERVAVIGPNGAGKTTLLKLIAGIIKPDSGAIEVSLKSGETGYEPQSPYIFKGSTEKNILIGSDGSTDIDEIISECCLESLRKKNARLLSGGEKQRVCFARMLSGNFSLLLLDEPLSAADIESSVKMETLLLKHCIKNNTTVLVSTHIPSQALRIATKVLIMNGGCVEEYSDIEKLEKLESEFGRLFVSQWKI